MRGGSGATAPASSGGAATAKGNIEKQILSFLGCNNMIKKTLVLSIIISILFQEGKTRKTESM